jgi:tetratricopeptide (TPR) repeat protein
MQMNQNDWSLAQRAETLRLSGAYEQAIDVFKQLANKYKDNAWVNAHLGTTYCQMMHYDEAERSLNAAITKNDKYLWAHAQLGETYRLLAIVNNRNEDCIANAIEHFQKALGYDIETSNYAWALAHLGATYRLKMTGDINLLKTRIAQQSNKDQQQSQEDPLEQIKKDALKCLNRALELIPTYAWAWGMRATVYRLAQDYDNSFWDLGVEAVIAPNLEVLQNSSSPVPFLESKRVNLYEHAFLSFYMTKKESDPEKKNLHYGRAIAYARQALILRPGDLIAQLILIIIEANQKKENQGVSLSQTEDVKEKVEKFFKDASELFNPCKKVLQHLIAANRLSVKDLESIRNEAGEEHKLTKLVLKDVIENHSLGVGENPQLWLWKNFALTETCSSVLSLLSDLSHILHDDPVIGEAEPYRKLAVIINPYYTLERLYQTPVLSPEERFRNFQKTLELLQAVQ